MAGLSCSRTCFAHFGCAGACADLALQSLNNLELMVETVREALSREDDPRQTAAELIRILGLRSDHGRSMFGGMSLQSVHGITRYLEKEKASRE